MLVLSFIAISKYNEAFYEIIDTKVCIEDYERQIKREKAEKNYDIVFKTAPEAYGKYNAFTYNQFLSDDPEAWTNIWIAKYYGLKTILSEG